MAEQEYIAPVKHSTGSDVSTTAAGAAGGALKTGAKTGIGWMAGMIGVGALIGLTGVSGGVLGFLGPMILGGAIGGFLGGLALPGVATIGALFGGITGGSKAHEQVQQERGQAAMIDAQIKLAQANNPVEAGTTIYVPTATNQVYQATPTATIGTAAPATQIKTGAMLQYDGLMNAQQLAAAR